MSNIGLLTGTPSGNGNTPTSSTDSDLVAEVRQLYKLASQAKQNRLATWERNWRMVNNRNWSSGRADWLPSPQASEVYPILAAEIGWMTDQRQEFHISASADPHSPYRELESKLANDLQAIIKTLWTSKGWHRPLKIMLWDALTFGTGFLKSGWDPAEDMGEGNVTMSRVDPWAMFPDPQAYDLASCNYIIERRRIPLDTLERRFPNARGILDELTGSEQVDQRPEVTGAMGGVRTNSAGLQGGQPRFGTNSNSSNTDLVPGVAVTECWMRENEVWEDDDGEEYIQDRWKVVVIAGDHILLNEKAEDLFSHELHPYSRYCFDDLGEFWGLSLVDHLAPCQIALNRLLAAVQANAELTANPVLKEDKTAGTQRVKMVNKPGQRIPINMGRVDAVQWMTPPPLPQYMLDQIKWYQAEMEKISGLNAIVRGATPAGRNAQGTIDAVQEAAFVRIRSAQRNLEWTLTEIGQHIVALIAENYSSPRIMAIVGPEGSQTAMALQQRHFYSIESSGEEPMQFSLVVNAGANKPTSPQARLAESDFLRTVGSIDEQAHLEDHEYPNREKVLQRIQQQKMMGLMAAPGARQRTRK